MNNEELIIYVVFDEDSETTLVTTVFDDAINNFGCQVKRGNAFLEVWKNNKCVYYTSWKSFIFSGNWYESFKEMIVRKIEEIKNA